MPDTASNFSAFWSIWQREIPFLQSSRVLMFQTKTHETFQLIVYGEKYDWQSLCLKSIHHQAVIHQPPSFPKFAWASPLGIKRSVDGVFFIESNGTHMQTSFRPQQRWLRNCVLQAGCGIRINVRVMTMNSSKPWRLIYKSICAPYGHIWSWCQWFGVQMRWAEVQVNDGISTNQTSR